MRENVLKEMDLVELGNNIMDQLSENDDFENLDSPSFTNDNIVIQEKQPSPIINKYIKRTTNTQSQFMRKLTKTAAYAKNNGNIKKPFKCEMVR